MWCIIIPIIISSFSPSSSIFIPTVYFILSKIFNYLTTTVSPSSTITLMISNNHYIIILTIITIIIRFFTLVLASIFARLSSSKLTIFRQPSLQAKWRAVNPYYNNNKEMRHQNKKNVDDDDTNYDKISHYDLCKRWCWILQCNLWIIMRIYRMKLYEHCTNSIGAWCIKCRNVLT